MRGDRMAAVGRLASLVVLAMVAPGRWAEGGPARYDPKTRTFQLTYTYAVVPSLGMTNDQVEQLGAVQDVTSDQDAKVRALFTAISAKLWQASDSRAKIGSLDHVDSVKQADILISPTGRVGRGGYATPGAIEGNQGHLVLFYEELTDEQEIDEELTVLHELSHYLFGLPDEYQDGETVGLCPLQNGSGPGCLMDNYLFNGPRHGWYGRFCDDDHNPGAPNPITVLARQSPQQSCKTLLDLFFQSRLKGDDALNPPAGDATNSPTPDQPFTGVFKSLVESTSSFLLDMIGDAGEAKKPAPTAGALQSAAQKFLRDQVAKNRSALGVNAPTADDIKRGIVAAIQAVRSSRVALPRRFDRALLDKIRQKAQGIAVREAARRGRSASSGLPQIFTSAAARDKAVAAVQKVIFAEIQKFARDALNLNDSAMAPEDRKFSEAEKAYLNQLALDTARGSLQDDNSEFARFLQAARIHIRISQLIARNTLDTGDDQGIVGTDIRRAALTDAERELEKLALKGNPFQPGFGLRRTLILAPYPVYVPSDGIRIQSTNTAAYRDIRAAFIEEFGSLIGRERIVVLPEELTPPLANVEGRDPAEKLRNVLRQIEFTSDQVRRNRIDNIVVLAPPGGLPEDLGDQLELLRKRMALNPDVRLDIVLFGQGRIPRRLRDASVRSVGSVLTVSDIDEFGAVAQRLRGEGTSGSWVIVPDQGRVDLVRPDADAKAVGPNPQAGQAVPMLRIVPLLLFRSQLRVYTYAYPDLGVPDPKKPDGDRDEESKLRRTPSLFDDLRRGKSSDKAGEYTAAYGGADYVRNVLINPIAPANVHVEPEKSPGYDLELRPWDDRSSDLKSNTSRVFVGPFRFVDTPDAELLYIRSFDAAGVITDSYEKMIDGKLHLVTEDHRHNVQADVLMPNLSPAQAEAIKALKQRLPGLLPPHNLSDAERVQVLNEAALIVGQPYCNVRNLASEVERYLFPEGVFRHPEKTEGDQGIKPYSPYSLLIARARWLNNNLKEKEKDKFNTLVQASRVQAVLDRTNELIGVLDELEADLFHRELEAADTGRAPQLFGIVIRAKQALARAIDPSAGALPERFRGPRDVFERSVGARQALEDVIRARRAYYQRLKGWLPTGRADQRRPEQRVLDEGFFEDLIGRWDATLGDLERCDQFEAAEARAGRQQADAGGLDDFFSKPVSDRDNYKEFLAVLAAIYVDLCNFEYELDRSLHTTRPFDRYPRPTTTIGKATGGGAGNAGGGDRRPDPLKLDPDDPEPVVFAPFTAEEDAEFDLVVGFSRPLDVDAVKQDPPRFKLMDGTGPAAREQPAPYLQLDTEKTTSTLLVYRLPNPSRSAGRLASGNYYPRLYLRDKHLPRSGGQIDYTFSIASRNPKVLLTASLRQIQLRDEDKDPENDAEVANRGIIVTSKSTAIVEALVMAGAAARDVKVEGRYQEVRAGGSKVEDQQVFFQDDGTWPDTTKGDGVYTAKIVLAPEERRKKAEYRVFIQAQSTDKTAFVPPAENFGKPDRPREDPDKKVNASTKPEDKPLDETTLPKVPRFQRATSVDFQVEGSE